VQTVRLSECVWPFLLTCLCAVAFSVCLLCYALKLLLEQDMEEKARADIHHVINVGYG
jgi:hypothetical protein